MSDTTPPGTEGLREALERGIRAAELLRAEYCGYSRPGKPASRCDCKFVNQETCGESTGCAEMRMAIGVFQVLAGIPVDMLTTHVNTIRAALQPAPPREPGGEGESVALLREIHKRWTGPNAPRIEDTLTREWVARMERILGYE